MIDVMPYLLKNYVMSKIKSTVEYDNGTQFDIDEGALKVAT